MPCSPDCENLSPEGIPIGEDCKYCDAINEDENKYRKLRERRF